MVLKMESNLQLIDRDSMQICPYGYELLDARGGSRGLEALVPDGGPDVLVVWLPRGQEKRRSSLLCI